MSESRPAAADLISIAQIARPQGRHGEVIADLLTDFPERFASLESVWAIGSSGEVDELRVERAWLHKDRIVLKFNGYDDMTGAEKLRGVRLAVARHELVTLPPDTYFDFDLVDCEVETTTGETLGRVTGVERYGAAPLLKVLSEKAEHLIPLTFSICIVIDVANKRIVVSPPDGLLEL